MQTWMPLTGGGHIDFSSGLETVLTAARNKGHRILASRDGWAGIEKDKGGIVDLSDYPTESVRALGGSFLGSSRTNPDLQRVAENLKKYGVDVVVAFGGDDTLSVARELHRSFGINVVGWPKTMDNDQSGNYATIGYATAGYIASKQVLEAFSTAYSHSRIVLVPIFGRNYDWVLGAAADYGHADFIIPAERKGLGLEDVANRIIDAYNRNRGRGGNPFAVVAISEGAVELKGLKEYLKKILPEDKMQYDGFGHPKLEPEILATVLKDAINDITGTSKENIAIKPETYHLRDSRLIHIDRVFAEKTAEECIRLIERGEFGRVATIQDPSVSGKLPDDPSTHIDANGKPLYVGSVPIEVATKLRPVADTNFIDYRLLTDPRATMERILSPRFTEYLRPLLGDKPADPRDRIVPFKAAKILVRGVGRDDYTVEEPYKSGYYIDQRDTKNDTGLNVGSRPRIAKMGLGERESILLKIFYRHGPGNGTALFLPFDQLTEHGPGHEFLWAYEGQDLDEMVERGRGSGDRRTIAELVKRGNFSGVVFHPGDAKIAGEMLEGVPLIYKIDAHVTQPQSAGIPSTIGTVEEALRYRADAIGMTLYPGSQHIERDTERVAKIIRDARNAGLISVVWTYARGPGVSSDMEFKTSDGKIIKGQTQADSLYWTRYAVHLASTFGADIVKTKFPAVVSRKNLRAYSAYIDGLSRDNEGNAAYRFLEPAVPEVPLTDEEHIYRANLVVREAPNSIVIFSGGPKIQGNPIDALVRQTEIIMKAGSEGGIYGRNIWGVPVDEGLRISEAVIDVMKRPEFNRNL